MMVGSGVWIYVMLFAGYEVLGVSVKPIIKDKSVIETPRMNSKMPREKWNEKFSNATLPSWSKFLEEFQKNETEVSNEIPDDTDELDPKIVNGRPANEGEFPWMVALHFNDRFICSSFLISPTIVMTAAHCVKFENGVEPASAFYGIIGNVRREGPETRITFREVAAHPQYGTGSEYDIAVFRLTSPVAMNERIRQICIPSAGSQLEIPRIQAMGWGATSNDRNQPAPEVLMTTELRVVSEGACRTFFFFLGISITEKHLCVNAYRATGVCFGDSGGPAVFDDPTSGKPVAVGVASFITFLGCGRPIVPNVYTRISSYIDWLTQTVGNTNDICFV